MAVVVVPDTAALAAKCITDEEVAELYRLLDDMKHDFEQDVMDDAGAAHATEFKPASIHRRARERP